MPQLSVPGATAIRVNEPVAHAVWPGIPWAAVDSPQLGAQPDGSSLFAVQGQAAPVRFLLPVPIPWTDRSENIPFPIPRTRSSSPSCGSSTGQSWT